MFLLLSAGAESNQRHPKGDALGKLRAVRSFSTIAPPLDTPFLRERTVESEISSSRREERGMVSAPTGLVRLRLCIPCGNLHSTKGRLVRWKNGVPGETQRQRFRWGKAEQRSE